MKAPRETDIVAACLLLLRVRGVFAWRVNSGAAVYGEGRQRRFVRFARGVKGVSDILGVLPGGKFLAVEVKRPGNTPTADQEGFLAQLNGQGGVGIVVTSVHELDNVLSRYL